MVRRDKAFGRAPSRRALLPELAECACLRRPRARRTALPEFIRARTIREVVSPPAESSDPRYARDTVLRRGVRAGGAGAQWREFSSLAAEVINAGSVRCDMARSRRARGALAQRSLSPVHPPIRLFFKTVAVFRSSSRLYHGLPYAYRRCVYATLCFCRLKSAFFSGGREIDSNSACRRRQSAVQGAV